MRTVSPFAACRNKRGGGRHIVTASGYRASNSGGLSIVGTYGYAWGSSPSSASSLNGSGLDFSSSGVYPEGSYSRSYGFPVRCVQE